MKIAILIGVSQYKSISSLPSCKSDVELIKKLLHATKQYNDSLCLAENEDCAKVKEKTTSFIKKHKGEDIEEVFFYYTGHGDFYEDEFYYMLSDFDSGKRRQNSLENSEVDNWLRSLKPNVTVKVVDACHSGMMYVKDDQAVEKYLDKSGKCFQVCYFMFSSKLE